MSIRSIVCCCGSGLGSSMMVRMNVEKALKNLGISGVEVSHTSLSEVTEDTADLVVVGRDLEAQVSPNSKKVVLDEIMNIAELQEKLQQVFAQD